MPSRALKAYSTTRIMFLVCASQAWSHGILGCAPSSEILAEWNVQEGGSIQANNLDRIVALAPDPQNSHGGIASKPRQEKQEQEQSQLAQNMVRPATPRTWAMAVRSSCPCTSPALKPASATSISPKAMAEIITIHVYRHENGMAELAIEFPIFLPGPVEPNHGPRGISHSKASLWMKRGSRTISIQW